MIEQLSFFEEDSDFSVKPTSIREKHREELYNYAKLKAKELWNREFDIEIKMNDINWTRRLACYNPNEKSIKMSFKINLKHSKENVYGYLLHEMVHWHLHTTNQPYDDSDINFALECIKVGAPLSGAPAAIKAKEQAERLLNLKN